MAKQTQPAAKYAFQCGNCGALEIAEAAGENPVPRSCRICRAGVKFGMASDGAGFSIVDEPQNWIVLADLPQKELAEILKKHGLTALNVVAHKSKVPAPPKGSAKHATATERMGAKDRG